MGNGERKMITSWWQQRCLVERNILIIIMLFLMLIVLYTLIWQPLVKEQQQKQMQVESFRHQLAWMQEQSPHLRIKVNASSQHGRDDNVAEIISRTGRQLKIPAQRIEPKGLAVDVFYATPQSFEQLVRWFQALERDYGIQVTQLELEAEQTGFVTVKRLRLGRRLA
ncbi:type II secretion system protein GspM [Yersinia enterocolitica]|uniref:type II secretion system protein GspM n=1 Tax=Yersinia enterocolitica TaxID=630 RepID=UPI0030B1A731|nr:type II secretion system protein M [Yersinia enterocolitica]EKN6081436.1 type II secretion system protein M [Yersinia enterocolitica]EKN6153996.1 type II secretion system protein M [Yersinia enterocolitica]EKN6173519.1 type II secretion system protein M [Yersinia enterocolitica]